MGIVVWSSRASVGAAEGDRLVDANDSPSGIGRVIESVLCNGDAVFSGIAEIAKSAVLCRYSLSLAPSTGDGEGLVEPDDWLPDIDRVIGSAICTGDAVTCGAVRIGEFAVFCECSRASLPAGADR